MAVLNSSSTQAELKKLYDSYDLPDTPGGFAVAIIQNGVILYKHAYGYANYEHQIPFTASSVVDYASVAKQFAGFAIASLIQQGRLKEEDELHQYLPESPDFGAAISIGHLLHHTSGIRDWVGLVQLSGRYENDVISDDFLMRLFVNQKELNFKPGERFQYSNLGYFLLAKIVARVTGQSLAQWADDHIFKPLKMYNTHFCEDYREIVLNRASAYKLDEQGRYLNSANQLVSYGSSSLYSTLDDMIKWMRNFETKELGGTELWEMMIRSGVLNNGEKTNYGYGISIEHQQGLESIGHGGSWAGNLCQLSYYPKENVSFILSINRDPAGFFAGTKFMDIILEKANAASLITKNNLDRREIPNKLGNLGEYVGAYLNGGKVIWVERGGSQLNFIFPSGQRVSTYPLEKDIFVGHGIEVQISFRRDDKDSVSELVYAVGGTESSGYKRQIADLSCLDDLCGEYYCPELNTSYTAAVKNGSLVLEHLHNEVVQLQQISEDAFSGNKWWCTQIVMKRNPHGQVSGFLLNCDGDNVQGLNFTKGSKGGRTG